MQQDKLFPRIRQNLSDLLNEYLQNDIILEHMDSYIVPPGLGDQSGILGALALAQSIT